MSIKIQIPAKFSVYGIFCKGHSGDSDYYYSAPTIESLHFTEKIFLESLGDKPSRYVDTLCNLGYYRPITDIYSISFVRTISGFVSEELLNSIENAYLGEVFNRISKLSKGLTDINLEEHEVTFKFAPNSFENIQDATKFLKDLAFTIHSLCYKKDINPKIIAENRVLKIRVHK